MIFDLSKKELAQYKAIDDGYEKLIADNDALLLELRPDDPEPPKPEQPPTIHTQEEADAYTKEQVRLFEEWEKAGSPKWQEARKKELELRLKQEEARTEFLEKCARDHFTALGTEPEKILNDAEETINTEIERTYKKYEKLAKTTKTPEGHQIVGFGSREIRVTDNGFFLDATEIAKRIKKTLRYHFGFFESINNGKEYTDRLNDYILETMAHSPYISSDKGKLGELVRVTRHDTTEEECYVTYPKDYVSTVDRISNKVFAGELVRPLNGDSKALWEVGLDGSKERVFARVAIDYTELLKSGAIKDMPTLSAEDYNVHDAIITQITAGNRRMTYEMIYRAMTGKVKGNIKVSDDIRTIIDEALMKFRARIKISYSGKDKDGNDVTIEIDEPIVTYNIASAHINGKLVEKAIIIPEDRNFDPPLLRWAKANRNELDTRDIILLDVPKLNNGRESSAVKMCLYRRIIKMRNEFDHAKGGKHELNENRRTIRYDFIYEALGLEPDDLTKFKRNDIKAKIDKCMSYWQEKGFITGYTHKRDKANGNTFYAVTVSFMPSGDSRKTGN